MSDDNLEEICIGHLFLADGLGQDERRKFAVDGRMLGVINCDFCIADEKNRQCRGYSPVKLHLYHVSEGKKD